MEGYIVVSYIVGLAIAAGIAFIPANIAKNKGYSFGLWWFYGWMLFIVAIIHALVLTDKNAAPVTGAAVNGQSAADELSKYKELLDCGVITEEEFQVKKEQLLKLM